MFIRGRFGASPPRCSSRLALTTKSAFNPPLHLVFEAALGRSGADCSVVTQMAGDSGSPTPPGVRHRIHAIEPVGNQATTQSLVRPPCFRGRLSCGCGRNRIENVKPLRSSAAHTLPIDRMRPPTNTLAPHGAVRGGCMDVRMLEAMAKLDEKVAGQRGGAHDHRTEPFAPAELPARLRSPVALAGCAGDAHATLHRTAGGGHTSESTHTAALAVDCFA